MTCGKWRDLVADEPVYRCRLCRGAVIPGNDGKAVSLSTGGYEYEHYAKFCVPDAPVPDAPAKKTRKRAKKNEGKA
jgi:hypothetical protein